MKTRITIVFALFILGLVSCRDEKIVTDPSSAVIWHDGEEELLDSIVEYNNSICQSREIWSYDEYGRKVECNSYSFDGREHYYKSEWSYSDGGKKITVIQYEKEGSKWKNRSKDIITVVADRDSCKSTYYKDNDAWILYGKYEHICDKEGRTVLESSYFPEGNCGNKIEIQYDDKGRCILNTSYSWSVNDWVLNRQTEYSFDENGNCIHQLIQRKNTVTGDMIGESLIERSFDNQNRENSYCSMKWNYAEPGWIGEKKYSVRYDNMGNVIENIDYEWDTEAKEWIPTNKSYRTFDKEGRTTVTADYVWRNNNWYGVNYKQEKRYDDNGNLLYEARYTWDELHSGWVLLDSKSAEYDSDGNLTHSVSESGDGSDRLEERWETDKYIREWNGFRRIEYKNEKGKNILVVYSVWLNGQWIDNERITISYDYKGREECNFTYTYYDGTWSLLQGYKYETIREGNKETRSKRTLDVNGKWSDPYSKVITVYDDFERVIERIDDFKKTEYAYDSNGNKTLIVISYGNADSNKWTPEEKTEYAFDSANNKILEARYRFNTNRWVGSEKMEAEYDVEGNKTIEIIYRWDSSSGEWYASRRTEFKYDSDGNLIDNASYDWGYYSGQWKWRCMYRKIYVIDPENNDCHEYNLEYKEGKWIGNRKEQKTDDNGNVIQEIYYSWDHEQWVITAKIERTYDYRNRLISTVKWNGNMIVYRKNTYYSIHKGMKVIDGMEF